MKEREIRKIINKMTDPVNTDVCVSVRDWEVNHLEEDLVFVLLEVHSEVKKPYFSSFHVDFIAYVQSIAYKTDFVNIDVLLIKRMLPNAFKMNISIYDEDYQVLKKKENLLMSFNN